MTRKHIYATGPGLRPNVFGIWRDEPGHSMYEDDEPEPATHWTTERSERDQQMSEFVRWRIARGERIAAESEQRRQRIQAARSAAAVMGADVFRAFIKGCNNGKGKQRADHRTPSKNGGRCIGRVLHTIGGGV